MVEFFSKFWTQLVETSNSIPTGKKVAMGAVAAIVLSGVLGVAYFANRPDYSVLFANLSPDDTSAITARLTEKQVPYKLAQDGQAIMVPTDKALELRLEMATSGLPSGGVVGYEVFDKSTFGMTEFVQQLNLKRALQGELARTIGQFREIQSARVHIAIPEKRLFTDDQTKPTASVVLKLASGRRLAGEKVKGIVHLVASSVENLPPENVTVVDVDGNVLAGGEPSDETALLSSTQFEYRSNLEKNLEKRISSMLESVVGQGKVVTRVSAEIDFTRTERTEKKFDPNSQVARSEQRVEQKSVGEQAPLGVPGVQSNVPGSEAAAQTAGTPATTSNNQETVNYEINETTQHVVEAVGTVKRLSIAVAVDGKYEEKDGQREFAPRSEEDVRRLTQLVKTAAGFVEARGDTVVVESAPFDMSRFEGDITEAKAEADRQFYAEIIKYAGIGILAVVIFMFIARPIIRSLTSANRELEALRALPQTVQQMEAKYGVSAEEEKDYRQRVRDVIARDPKAAAEMVREWLNTRR
ncbi:MAG: flagellar M-ring protein FliF [Nitrospinae bacterium]|nr:flagellar M-ring protein FliF [Nitrospinota bacterium]